MVELKHKHLFGNFEVDISRELPSGNYTVTFVSTNSETDRVTVSSISLTADEFELLKHKINSDILVYER